MFFLIFLINNFLNKTELLGSVCSRGSEWSRVHRRRSPQLDCVGSAIVELLPLVRLRLRRRYVSAVLLLILWLSFCCVLITLSLCVCVGFPPAAWQYIRDVGLVAESCDPYPFPPCSHHVTPGPNGPPACPKQEVCFDDVPSGGVVVVFVSSRRLSARSTKHRCAATCRATARRAPTATTPCTKCKLHTKWTAANKRSCARSSNTALSKLHSPSTPTFPLTNRVSINTLMAVR